MTPPTLQQKLAWMASLSRVVHHAGTQLLERVPHGSIADTHDVRGHESSTIDVLARQLVLNEIERHFPEFEGYIRTELSPIGRTPLEAEVHHDPYALIVDEIDGTTNAKRCFAGLLPYRPQSLVSAALSTSDRLSDVAASAVFTLDTGDTFAAVRAEDESFLSFRNRHLIDPEGVKIAHGDSRSRIYVIGYSNSFRINKGLIEQALYDANLKVYEGCRASGMDLINLVRNSADAYVDLRRYWSRKDARGKEQEAMLQVYDVAGVLPIAMGCGLVVTDALGNPWQQYGSQDSISLVVARPDIHPVIIETIKPFIEGWKLEG